MASARQIQSGKSKIFAVNALVFDTVPLNLEELTDMAEVVFSGTCIKSREIEASPKSKFPAVEFTFLVDSGIRGVKDGETYSFKQWKATVGNEGYKVGESYVIFLHGKSKIGLTSPVGFYQGQFRVSSENSRKFVSNRVNNIGLVENIKTKKRISLRNKALEKEFLEKIDQESKLELNTFLNIVKDLAEE